MTDSTTRIPTDADIIALADKTRTGEPGRDGYILPISFARAVLAKWCAPAAALLPELTSTAAAEVAAPIKAGEYPPLVCDYCGALTPDPWHSSGMMNGKMSKHIHSCDSCAARGAAKAAPAEAENEIDLLAEAALCERLDTCLAAARAAQKEAND